MKKRVAALIAVLALCLAAVPQAALADAAVGLGVETTSGAAGSDVSVVVALDSCTGLDSLQFRLNYDPAALTLNEAEAGPLLSGGLIVINTDEEGLIRVAYASAYGLTESGIALQLSFTPLTDAGGAVTVSEALATRVDEAFVQTKAYLRITDGGIQGTSGSMPDPIATPWIAETPLPSATPESAPTQAPTQTPQTGADADMPEPSGIPFFKSPAALAAAGAALVILAILIVVLAGRRGRKK